MKYVVWKAFANYEKEEKYLNEMAAKGLALTDYSWCRYVFEDAPPGEYIYRLELLENPVRHPESQKYIRFMEETGVEFVASYSRWVYFRKKSADGEFDIYSDIDSKIRHFKRIRSFTATVAAANLLAGLSNLHIGYTNAAKGLPPVNSYISIISFVIFCFALIGLILPLSRKIASLKKDRDIRE